MSGKTVSGASGDGGAYCRAGRERQARGQPGSFSRLISAGNSCTSQGMSDEAAILAANAAYYRAFTSADFAAMSRLWADDNVSCIHPGWPVLLGRQAILESYREILRNPDQERIDPRNETVMATGDEARVFCVEFAGGRGPAPTPAGRPAPPGGGAPCFAPAAAALNPGAPKPPRPPRPPCTNPPPS